MPERRRLLLTVLDAVYSDLREARGGRQYQAQGGVRGGAHRVSSAYCGGPYLGQSGTLRHAPTHGAPKRDSSGQGRSTREISQFCPMPKGNHLGVQQERRDKLIAVPSKACDRLFTIIQNDPPLFFMINIEVQAVYVGLFYGFL